MTHFPIHRNIFRGGLAKEDCPNEFDPKSMIDTLYNYGDFLQRANIRDPPSIAQEPPPIPKEVAIIGAGASGN